MVKAPKARHSKVAHRPVTIDLSPGDVSRVRDEDECTTATVAADTAPPAPQENDIAGDPVPRASEDEADEALARQAAAGADEARDEAVPDPSDAPAGNENTPAGGAPAGRDRSAFWPAALASGVLGGLVVAAVGGGLLWAGILPLPARSDTDHDVLAALRRDVDALKPQATGAATQSDLGNARQAIDHIAARADANAKSLAALQAQAARLGEAGNGGSADAAALKSLDGRIGKVESGLETLRAAPAESGALDALKKRLGAIETAQKSDDAATADIGRRLSRIETSIGGLSKQVKANADQPDAAAAIAANSLKSAVDRGGSFTGELDAYAAVVPGSPQLAPLRKLAAAGAPTKADLSADADTAVDAMMDALRGGTANAGIFARLESSARSLVTVRPIGNVEGDTPQAIAARMEVAVRQGDYAAAIGDFGKLPAKARAAGASFAARVKARMDAESLAEKAVAGALKPRQGAGQ